MNEIDFTERTTLTGAAALFGMARSTFSGWRSTDARFPRPDEGGQFSTVEISAFLELKELERMTPDAYQAQRREGADRLEQHIEAGMFPGAMAGRCKRIVADMRNGDHEAARRSRIEEIEQQLRGES